ncbi:hypothetical protein FRX31_021821 [Thalictrum thalictroides]|uniref:BED-type domain-containing protein n=1 Tax=Thalictrum thalictroides TaxID=46969 RepID=A0A7J6VW88_THATH|nr:hypothetical protein FRX31_021821 [Thalictrum thalictroides]
MSNQHSSPETHDNDHTHQSNYISLDDTNPSLAPNVENVANATDAEEEEKLKAVKKARKAPVWEHFTIFFGPHPKTSARVLRAACNMCHKPLGAGPNDGTRHLSDHLKSCANKRKRDAGQPTLSQDRIGNVVAFTYSQTVARIEILAFKSLPSLYNGIIM